MPNLKFLLEQHGLSYSVERNGVQIYSSICGLPNTEKSTAQKYIGFLPETDIKPGDFLINPANERFFVINIQTHFFQQEPYQLKAYYQTEYDKVRHEQFASPVFNIGNAYGSVIGTQQNVSLNYENSLRSAKEQLESSDSPDKEELQHIISLLEMITSNQLPPQKGLLSKFSAVMERNSWITGTITSVLLSWLTSQI